MAKYSVWIQNFSAMGSASGLKAPIVNLGPPNISENTRIKALKLKTQLDMIKYSR